MALVFWLIILAISGWAELHTNTLVGGFFALGAIVALVLDTAHVLFDVQAIVWFAVSVLATLALRPFALRTMGKRQAGDVVQPTATTLAG
jgi:membrane protein implicated in regulation of membrane protease activity